MNVNMTLDTKWPHHVGFDNYVFFDKSFNMIFKTIFYNHKTFDYNNFCLNLELIQFKIGSISIYLTHM